MKKIISLSGGLWVLNCEKGWAFIAHRIRTAPVRRLREYADVEKRKLDLENQIANYAT